MKLLKTSAAAWGTEMQLEAKRNGYRVEFEATAGGLIASFYNGEFFCYSREWHA